MIRFSYSIYYFPLFCNILSLACIFTSFYAGINSLFERDIKKLIALSTLSHLGFIGLSFSLGFLSLSFFHLLSHALFKSLLFITIGDIIINLSHSQDIRFLSSGCLYTPFSSSIMNVSILSLLGIPNVRGYFSKDLILESFNYCSSSLFLIIILYVNLFFTYFYSYLLLSFSFSSNKLVPFLSFHSPINLHFYLLSFISIISFSFGFFFISFFIYDCTYFITPYELKFFPLLVNSAFFLLCFF
jgi:NADH-ubiquinone oxidoreductase chain 5